MAAASGKRKGLSATRWEVWMKCDYCHGLSSGVKCANCGAPLPEPMAHRPPSNEFPRVNLSGQSEYERLLAQYNFAAVNSPLRTPPPKEQG